VRVVFVQLKYNKLYGEVTQDGVKDYQSCVMTTMFKR